MLALGATGPEVAEALYLSPETVRSHTRTARRKLGARTRSQALALAIKSGQIDVRSPSGGAR
jgi:DNA-binding CsgD family transcriptional regulator